MNASDVQYIYEELLELEGLALLIKERLMNEPLQVSNYFADKLSRLNSRVEQLMGATEAQDSVDKAIAESAEIEEAEDAGTAIDDAEETSINPDSDIPEPDEPDEVYDSDSDSKPYDESVFSAAKTDEIPNPKLGFNDLRRAFTINDRFRFRRELFGNSDSEMTDTINMVSAMNSFGEAEEYFYDDLGWDKSADEVKDFMLIIERHFNGRII